jgi:AcrR family transcriptional regulator
VASVADGEVTVEPRHLDAESRRARILDAMVLVVHEHGFAHTTVTTVCAQARVSRGTFYEEFAGLRECFLAVMDDGYRCVHRTIEDAFEGAESWRAGLRAALAAVLAFFDAEPVLARVWLIETLAAGAWALERRERHVAELTGMIMRHWPLPDDVRASRHAVSAAMESVLGAIRTHLVTGRKEPLIALLGPLTGIVTMPFLAPPVVAEEIAEGVQLAQAIGARAKAEQGGAQTARVEVPALLHNPRARRLRKALLYISEHPGVSNRQVAQAIGLTRDDQISTILARLADTDLIGRRHSTPGGSNQWVASPSGVMVARELQRAHSISAHRTTL